MYPLRQAVITPIERRTEHTKKAFLCFTRTGKHLGVLTLGLINFHSEKYPA